MMMMINMMIIITTNNNIVINNDIIILIIIIVIISGRFCSKITRAQFDINCTIIGVINMSIMRGTRRYLLLLAVDLFSSREF